MLLNERSKPEKSMYYMTVWKRQNYKHGCGCQGLVRRDMNRWSWCFYGSETLLYDTIVVDTSNP